MTFGFATGSMQSPAGGYRAPVYCLAIRRAPPRRRGPRPTSALETRVRRRTRLGFEHRTCQCQSTAQRANLVRTSSYPATAVTKRNTTPRESIADSRSRYTGVRTRHTDTDALNGALRRTPLPARLTNSDRDYSRAAPPIIMTMCPISSKAICHIVAVISLLPRLANHAHRPTVRRRIGGVAG